MLGRICKFMIYIFWQLESIPPLQVGWGFQSPRKTCLFCLYNSAWLTKRPMTFFCLGKSTTYYCLQLPTSVKVNRTKARYKNPWIFLSLPGEEHIIVINWVTTHLQPFLDTENLLCELAVSPYLLLGPALMACCVLCLGQCSKKKLPLGHSSVELY